MRQLKRAESIGRRYLAVLLAAVMMLQSPVSCLQAAAAEAVSEPAAEPQMAAEAQIQERAAEEPQAQAEELQDQEPEIQEPQAQAEVQEPEVQEPAEELQVQEPEVQEPAEEPQDQEPEVQEPIEEPQDQEPEVQEPAEELQVQEPAEELQVQEPEVQEPAEEPQDQEPEVQEPAEELQEPASDPGTGMSEPAVTEAETQTDAVKEESETESESESETETETESEIHTPAEITDDSRQLKLNLGSAWYLDEEGGVCALEELEGALDYRAVSEETLKSAEEALTAGFTVLYRLRANGEDRSVHAGDWFTVSLPECMKNIRLTEKGEECRGGADETIIDGVSCRIMDDAHTLKVTFKEPVDEEDITDIHGKIGLTFDIEKTQLTEEAAYTLTLQQGKDGLNEYTLYLPKAAQPETESETETEAETETETETASETGTETETETETAAETETETATETEAGPRRARMRRQSGNTDIPEMVDDIVLKVHWNDNNEKTKRPDQKEFAKKIKANVTVRLNGKELSAEEWKTYGINPQIEAVINPQTVATWDFKVNGLPKYAEIDGGKEELQYKVSMAVPESVTDYVAPVMQGEREVTYTLGAEYSARKIWYDRGAVTDGVNRTRPSVTEFASKLSLYRYLSDQPADKAEKLENASDAIQVTEGDNATISLNTDMLPAYDENGHPYVYFIEEETGVSEDTTVGTYEAKYVNNGNYAGDKSRLYDDGVLTNTLRNTTTFSVNKVWKDGKDGKEIQEARPNTTLHLYRYADDGTSSFESQSPVSGFDSMEVLKKDQKIEFVDVSNKKELPMYDQFGQRYVYFAVEQGLTGDYISEVERNEKVQEDSRHILNGDTLVNRLAKDEEIKGRKTFIAAAMQGTGEVEVTLQLQRRVKKEQEAEQGVWENVEDAMLTLKDFSPEATSVEESFGKFPKYDKDGYEYEYRYVETSVAVHGEKAEIDSKAYDSENHILTIPELTAPGVGDSKTTAKFRIERAEDGSVVNRLIGETQVLAKKEWHGDDGNGAIVTEAPEGATVYIRLHREDDGKASIVEGEQPTENTLRDAEGNAVYDIVLNGTETDNWQEYFKHLVRYDENGAEYTYKIEEIADKSTLGDYSFDRIEYEMATNTDPDSGDTVTELQAKVINTKGKGEKLIFDLEKVWIDESDLLDRHPVLVGIYEKGTTEPVVTEVLSENNDWKKRVYVQAKEGKTTDNYYVREISIEEPGGKRDPARYFKEPGNDEYTNKEAIFAGTAPAAGEAATTEHLYRVYLQCNKKGDGHDEYIIYNQRYGSVTLNLTKTWTAAGVPADQLPKAVFELLRTDKDGKTETLTFTDGTKEFALKAEAPAEGEKPQAEEEKPQAEGEKPQAVWTSDGQIEGMKNETDKLPKYDSQGRLYSYALKEIRIGDGVVDKNGSAKTGTDTYITSVSYDHTEPGSKHTDDTVFWTAENTRQETANLTVNKIWGDDGSAVSHRPDVSFSVYRTIKHTAEEIAGGSVSLAEGLADGTIETVVTDRIWDTKKHDNWWCCELQDLPRYNEHGEAYVYFLQETMSANAEGYETHYYNGQVTPKLANQQETETQTGNPAAPADQAAAPANQAVAPADQAAATVEQIFAPNPQDNAGDFGRFLILQDKKGTPYSRTVVNTRNATRYIDGKKIWTYLPNAFEKEHLPDIELDIYRGLGETFPSDEEMPQAEVKGTIEKVNKEQPITLNRANNFKFTYGKAADGTYTLPRYDKYGRLYNYFVYETTKLEGYEIHSVIANQFTVENIYQPKTMPAEIEVSKTWEGLEDGARTPDITFELWRKLQNADGTEIANTDKLVDRKTLESKTYNKPATQPDTITFTEAGANGTKKGDNLPYYAPNGQPYIYYVKEIVPKGYEAKTGETGETETTVAYGNGSAACSSHTIKLEKKEENGAIKYTGTVSFTNRYHGKSNDQLDIAVTKNWEDGDNRFNTRPGQMSIQLWRKTKTLAAKEVGNPQTFYFETKPGCEFTDLERYATTGEEYTYYVTEVASENDAASLDSYLKTDGTKTFVTVKDSGDETIALKNTLETVNITAKKVFEGTLEGTAGNKVSLTADQMKILFEMGAVPADTTFTFKLQKKNDESWADVTEWDDNGMFTKECSHSVTVASAADLANLCNKTFAFTGLPKYEKGYTKESTDANNHLAEYRVIEEITGTSGTGSVFTATYGKDKKTKAEATGVTGGGEYLITNTMPVREVQIDKFWDDNTNRDNTRPASLTVTLTRDNESTQTHMFTLTKTNQMGQDVNAWTTGVWYVPLYKNGQSGKYSTYSAAETALTGYNQGRPTGYPKHTENDPLNGSTDAADNCNWFGFQNTLTTKDTRDTVELTANKEWNENGSRVTDESDHPDVYFTLQVKVKTSDGKWEYVSATPENSGLASGQSATKKAECAPGASTESVTWTGLWRYRTQTTAVAERMEYKVIETTADGTPVTATDTNPYTPKEAMIQNAGTGAISGTVTNTLKTVTVKAKKIWKKSVTGGQTDNLTKAEFDSLKAAGALPEKIKFQLFHKTASNSGWEPVKAAAISETAATPAAPAENLTFEEIVTYTQGGKEYETPLEWGLPKYTKEGAEIQYLVKETALQYAGSSTWVDISYSSDNTLTGSSGSFAVTNELAQAAKNTPAVTTVTNTIPLGSVKVEKTWEDENGRDGVRPTNITLQLKRDDVNYGDPVNVKPAADGSWSYTWNSLPIYQNGKTGDSNKSRYTVVETQVTDYNAPEYKYGETTGAAYVYAGSSADVNADVNAGRSADINAGSKISVTNEQTAMKRITIQATKSWNDKDQPNGVLNAKPSVTLKLQYQNGTDAQGKVSWNDVTNETLSDGRYPDGTGVYTTDSVSQTISADQTAKWENLPVYRLTENGAAREAIRYRVVEDPVTTGYEASYNPAAISVYSAGGNKTQSVTVTNTLKTTSLVISKTWEQDTYETAKVRPVSVTMELLYRHGAGASWQKYGEYVLSASNDIQHNWKTTVNNLPVKDIAGNAYEYYVKEAKITYTNAANTDAETNTDAGTAADVPVSEETAYNAENLTWSGSAGTYTASVTMTKPADENGTWTATAVNTRQTTEFTAEKTWNDNGNRDGKRPQSITLQLKRDGEAFGDPVTVSKGTDGTWKHTWTNLPKYQNDSTKADQKLSVYTVEETALDTALAYQTAQYAYTKDAANVNASAAITNTHTPESFTIEASKKWLGDKTDVLRPASVQLTLQAKTSENGSFADVTKADSTAYLQNETMNIGAYTTSDVTQTVTGTGDTWTGAKWENLPVYSNGYQIQYKVVEVTVSSSYEKTDSTAITGGNGTTKQAKVTNKLKETVTVTVSKNWDDAAQTGNNEALNLMPDAVNVQLQYRENNTASWKDVAGYGAAQLTKDNNWSKTFGDDAHALRADYQYRVIEVSLTYSGNTVVNVAYAQDSQESGTAGSFSYEAKTTYDGSNKKYSAELKNTLQKTSLVMTKSWSGDDHYTDETIRPASVTMELMYRAEGEQTWKSYGSYTLQASSDPQQNWRKTVENLPVKDRNGKPYEYYVEETKITYTKAGAAGAEVTASAGTYTAAGHAWSGSVGTYTASVTMAKANDGTWTAAAVNTLETTQFTAAKTWNDNGDRDGRRPQSITLQLKRDGAAFGEPVTVTKGADGTWKHTWENLPKYQNDTAQENRTASVYTVEETKLDETALKSSDTYTASYKDGSITNTHTPETFTITASKSWLNGDVHGQRPASVQLKLQASVSADGVTYSDYADVIQDAAKGYLAADHAGSGAYTTSAAEQTISRRAADTENLWTGAKWENLPVYSGGYLIRYKVVETNTPDSYISTESGIITGEAGNGETTVVRTAEVSNKLKGTVTVTAEKNWEGVGTDAETFFGVMPDAVKVQLEYSADDGTTWQAVTKGGTAALTAENNWRAVFGSAENPLRNDYRYRVVEVSLVYGDVAVPVKHDGKDETAGTAGSFLVSSATEYNKTASSYDTKLTNTLDTTQISVKKEWNDQNNRCGSRPQNDLTVKLQRRLKAGAGETEGTWEDVKVSILPAEGSDGTGSERLYTETLQYNTETKTWSEAVFGGLPKKDEHGRTWEYRAVEVQEVPGYTESWKVSADKTVITNTLQTTSLVMEKTWAKDTYETAKVRPVSVTMELFYRHGQGSHWTKYDEYTLTASGDKAADWKRTVLNLPAKDSEGNKYEYYVKETKITYASETGDVSVSEKAPYSDTDHVWSGAAGTYTASVTTAKADGENGAWTASAVNTLETTQFTAEKTWNDNGDRDGRRPQSITLQLMRDGAAFGSPVTVTKDADGNWKHTWENLPKYQNDSTEAKQKLSVYTAEETKLGETALESSDAYTASYEGGSITNTHTPETFTITASKSWLNKDAHSQRPAAVTLKLQASLSEDGKTYSEYKDVVQDVSKAYLALAEEEAGSGAYTTSAPAQTVSRRADDPEDLWGGAQWNDLPVYSGGYLIRYRVIEAETPDSYVSEESGIVTGEKAAVRTAEVSNKLEGTVTAAVEKEWLNIGTDIDTFFGVMPDAVKVQLEYSADGGKTWQPAATEAGKAALTKENGWKAVFGDAENPLRNDYRYRVVEVSLVYGDVTVPVNYSKEDKTAGTAGSFLCSSSTEYEEDASTYRTKLTNTLDTTQIRVNKVWEDQENRCGSRPQKDLTVKLQRRLAAGEGEAESIWEDVKVSVKPAEGSDENGGERLYTAKLAYDAETGAWSEAVFTGLPKTDEQGRIWEYRAAEAEEVPGYTESLDVSADQTVITNTLQTTSLAISKEWLGDSGYKGENVRPASVTMELWYRHGESLKWEKYDEYTLTASEEAKTDWKQTVLDLLVKDSEGNAYEYYVKEAKITYTKTGAADETVTAAGGAYSAANRTWSGSVGTYTTSVTMAKANDGTWTAAAVNTLQTTQVKAVKKWADQSGDALAEETMKLLDAHGALPKRLRFGLYRRVGETGAWEAVKDRDGSDIILTEKAALSAEQAYEPGWLLPEYSNEKAEDGSFTAYQYMLKEIAVSYKESGETAADWQDVVYGGSQSLNGRSGSFAAVNVPQEAVQETPAVTTVINMIPLGSVKAEKIWQDENDRDGERPDSIILQLKRDGADYGEAVTVRRTEDGSWSHTWDNLPVYQNGKTGEANKSVYTVEERQEEGYRAPVYGGSVSTDGTLIVTNKKAEMQRITIQAVKNWQDKGQLAYGVRDENENVTLALEYLDTADNRWKQVEQKRLTDGRYPDGDGVYTTSSAVQKTAATEAAPARWENLPVYRLVTKDGKTQKETIAYRVAETQTDGYQAPQYSIDEMDSGEVYDKDGRTETVTVTNVLQTTSLVMEKTWSGDDYDKTETIRPSSVTMELLYRHGDGSQWKTYAEYTLSASGNEETDWRQTVSDLPAEDSEGNVYEYYVKEAKITYTGAADKTAEASVGAYSEAGQTWSGAAGTYTAAVTTTKADGENGAWTAKAVNTLETTQFTAEKTWNDNGDRDGRRPQSITLQLMRDGAAFGDPVTVTEGADGTWKYTWQNLPKYQNDSTEAKQKLSVYTAEETKLGETALESSGAYTASYEGGSITNTHAPETFTITASKKWLNEDAQAQRPAEIALKLQASLSEDGKTYSEYKDVVQDVSKAYLALAEEEAGSGAYTTSAPAQTISRRADDPENLWSGAQWNDLPVYSHGYLIRYRVIEAETPDSYVSEESGIITGEAKDGETAAVRTAEVSNKLEGTVTAAVEKEWLNIGTDIDTFFGVMPDAVKVQLEYSADGGKTWQPAASEAGKAALTKENGWKAVFGDAENPLRNDYRYRIVEESLVYGEVTVPVKYSEEDKTAGTAGSFLCSASTEYEESASTYRTKLTNTLDTTQISVQKEWIDQDNCYNTRPQESLTVKLQRRPAAEEGEAESSWEDVAVSEAQEIAALGKQTETYENGGERLYTAKLAYDAETGAWAEAVFAGLPKTDENGRTWEYRAVEAAEVPGYVPSAEVTADKTTITNTLETVDLAGSKTWIDSGNAYQTRPESIELTISDQNQALAAQPEILWEKQDDVWTWKASGLPKYLAGTNTEAVYTVTEQPVEGYRADAETVETAEGTADFVNRLIAVQFVKTDRETKQPLAGAKLMVCDMDGNVIESWTSEKTPHVIAGRLTYGKQYQFVEISAPDGYEKAESITFTAEAGEPVQTVTMEDPKTQKTQEGRISVTKFVTYGGSPMSITMSYYAALFADEELTERVSSVKEIHLEDAFAGTVTFENLAYGTYYAAETDEYGNAVTGEQGWFTNVITDGHCVLNAANKSANAMIENRYEEFPPEANTFVKGKITVEKHVTNGEEEIPLENASFYAALFMDEEHQYRVSDVKELHMSNSSRAKTVFSELSDGTYYLAETDEYGNALSGGEDGFDYVIDMPESAFTIGETAEYSTVFSNINEDLEIETETEKPTESETNPPETGKTPKTSSAAKTADETDIMLWMMLMFAAAAVLLTEKKRKKE